MLKSELSNFKMLMTRPREHGPYQVLVAAQHRTNSSTIKSLFYNLYSVGECVEEILNCCIILSCYDMHLLYLKDKYFL